MKESKLKLGDFVKVHNGEQEFLGEWQWVDQYFICIKSADEYVYVPNSVETTVTKPFVTVPEQPPT